MLYSKHNEIKSPSLSLALEKKLWEVLCKTLQICYQQAVLRSAHTRCDLTLQISPTPWHWHIDTSGRTYWHLNDQWPWLHSGLHNVSRVLYCSQCHFWEREGGRREKSSLCFAIRLLARILLTTTMAVTGQTMTGVQCTLTLHTPVSRAQVTTGEARWPVKVSSSDDGLREKCWAHHSPVTWSSVNHLSCPVFACYVRWSLFSHWWCVLCAPGPEHYWALTSDTGPVSSAGASEGRRDQLPAHGPWPGQSRLNRCGASPAPGMSPSGSPTTVSTWNAPWFFVSCRLPS